MLFLQRVLAAAYLDAKRDDAAARVLEQLPPKTHAQDALELAILARRAGQQERAHQLFRDAGEIVLGNARAAHEFARTKIWLAKRLRPSRRRLDREARVRLLREAEELLRRVLQMDAPPARHAWAWFDLGRVLQRLKAPEGEVRRAFEEANRLLPGEPRFSRELSARRRP